MTTDTSRERRLRNMAARHGLRLNKSRTRDPLAVGFAKYSLTDRHTGAVVSDGTSQAQSSLTIDEAEVLLSGASDFDVYFHGVVGQVDTTGKPALIFGGTTESIETWRLVDRDGHDAEIEGSRNDLVFVVVEARRYVQWWSAEAANR